MAAVTARTGAGLAPHGAAVALEEQHQRRLGRLIGVLPDPGAVRVGGAEGSRHGLAKGAGIQCPARLEDRQQAAGGSQQRGGFADCGGGECGGGRTRGRGRRRVGVEHERAPVTGCGEAGTERGRRKALPQRSVRPAPDDAPPVLLAAERDGPAGLRAVALGSGWTGRAR